MWFDLNVPLWFLLPQSTLHTVGSVLALTGNDSLACVPKLLLGSPTSCSFVLYVFPLSHHSENDQRVPF